MHQGPGTTRCGSTAIYADDEITGQVLTALSDPATLARLLRAAAGDDADDTTVISQLRAAEACRDELAAAWAAGEITRKEWATARQVINDQTTHLTRQLSRNEHDRALASFATTEGDLWERWAPRQSPPRRHHRRHQPHHRPPRHHQAMDPGRLDPTRRA